MADNTVYINRVQKIPTSNSLKGIYLYSDPITNVKGIYVVANNEVTDLLESKLSKGRVLIDGEYVSINSLQDIFNNVSTGGGTGSYINTHPILLKIGGILKDTDFSTSFGINTILNKMFFPNLGKTFPTNPVFVGFMRVYPTLASVLLLFNPEDFYEFDFNEVIDEGFIVIALPATYYLSRVEDTNGLNIVNSFELIYKSIPLQNGIDIYNVYVSPELVYNDRLELTFTSVVGTPVLVVLESGEISVDDVIPTIKSLNIKEGIKSVVNNIDINIKDIQPILDNMAIGIRNVLPIVKSVKCIQRDVNVTLNNVNVHEGTKSVINSISIKEDVNSILTGISIKEDVMPSIVSLNMKEGKSVLNNISISTRINNVNLTYTFSNEDAGSADGSINLECSIPDQYYIYWGEDYNIILGMSEIVILDITAPSYSKVQNIPTGCMIPESANSIIVKSVTTGEINKFSLPNTKLFNQTNLGSKLYSFGLVADVHCGANILDNQSYALTNDVPKAWLYFNEQGVNFVCGIGDIEDDDISTQITAFAGAVAANNPSNLAFYSPKGNNDSRLTPADWLGALNCTENFLVSYGDHVNNIIDPAASLSYIYRNDIAENDIFLFQSVDPRHKSDPLESPKRLILESILAENTTKRIFYFMHMPMDQTAGDVNGILGDSYPLVDSEFYIWFMNLMANNKNVIFFSGHTHNAFESALFDNNANAFNGAGLYGWFVHMPSLGKPRVFTNATTFRNRYDMSLGAIVEVYENSVILRGIDFGILYTIDNTYITETHAVPTGLLLLKTT